MVGYLSNTSLATPYLFLLYKGTTSFHILIPTQGIWVIDIPSHSCLLGYCGSYHRKVDFQDYTYRVIVCLGNHNYQPVMFLLYLSYIC